MVDAGMERDMTVQQTAEVLQVHPETIRVWCRQGRFPHAYALPGRAGWRIPVGDLRRLKDGAWEEREGAAGEPA